jgi:hypothetical protein
MPMPACLTGLLVSLSFSSSPAARVKESGRLEDRLHGLQRAETSGASPPIPFEKVGVVRPGAVDTQDFEKRFKAGEFALAHSNSLIYIILKERYDLQLVASEQRGQVGSSSAGAIIARAGSGIRKLDDIRGKRMAFGPMLAPTGYLAEYDLMLRSGIDPERDLGYLIPPARTNTKGDLRRPVRPFWRPFSWRSCDQEG